MGPAGPSLEEASCGAGLVGRLCQKGLMLPTGPWEEERQWPSSGDPTPHQEPLKKSLPRRWQGWGSQAQMTQSNAPSSSQDGNKPRSGGRRGIQKLELR